MGAEQSGVIGRLTEYVLDRALRDVRQWHGQGHATIGVAVNVAAANLVDGHFPDRLEAALRARGVAPEAVTLELRESATLADGRARAIVRGVHALGVRVSIDDFGRATSSLTLLRALAAHEVKLDGAVVRNVLARSADARLAAAIITAAHALGLTVVAKGVETAATWQRLTDLGCDAAQGFELCRPLPAEELVRWMRGHAM